MFPISACFLGYLVAHSSYVPAVKRLCQQIVLSARYAAMNKLVCKRCSRAHVTERWRGSCHHQLPVSSWQAITCPYSVPASPIVFMYFSLFNIFSTWICIVGELMNSWEQIVTTAWCLSCASILVTKWLKEYFNIFHVIVTLLKSTVTLQLCLYICRAYSSESSVLGNSSSLQHKPYISGRVVTWCETFTSHILNASKRWNSHSPSFVNK